MQSFGRHSFVVFALIGGAGVVMGIRALAQPLGFFDLVHSASGVDLNAASASDPETARGLSFLGRWIGTQLLGLDGLTLVLAITAYRRGDRLVWALMWYWPAMFVSHALLYRPWTPLFYVQLVNLTLSAAALLAARPQKAVAVAGV